jgi:hypothetical protein
MKNPNSLLRLKRPLTILMACIFAAVLPPGSAAQVLDNGILRLTMDPQTCAFSLEELGSGLLWRSNPPGALGGPIASQIKATLYDEGDKEYILDSADHAVRRGGASITNLSGALKVTYHFSNYERGEDDIPVFLSRRRFEAFFINNPSLEPDDVERMTRRYTLDQELDGYRRFRLPSFEVPRILEILDKAAYTSEELQWDNEENAEVAALTDPNRRILDLGIKMVTQPGSVRLDLEVSIEYRLEGDSLISTIDAGAIKVSEGSYLRSLDVLEYFGAGRNGSTGWFLVPDGPGALIRFDRQSAMAPAYRLMVHGPDIQEPASFRVTEALSASLPVFGSFQTGPVPGALLAYLETGAEHGVISYGQAGRSDDWHTLSSSFRIREPGTVVLGADAFSVSRKLVFPRKAYDGLLSIRWFVLPPEHAHTAGAALRLSRHLSQVLDKPAAWGMPEGLALEFIGGIRRKRIIAGLSFDLFQPITSFAQAGIILSELRDGGLAVSSVRFTGWYNGGLDPSLPGPVRVEKALGGNSALAAFADQQSRAGTALFMDASLLRWKGTPLLPPYRAARTFSQLPAREPEYDLATFMARTDRDSRTVLSPVALQSVVERFLSGIRRLKVSGLSFRDLGRELKGDYRRGDEHGRSEALKATETAFLKITEAGIPIMGQGPALLTLPWATHLADLPLDSSGHLVLDETVPFAFFALRELVSLSPVPVNDSPTPARRLLQSLEAGVVPAYLLGASDSRAFKDTEYDRYYAISWESWKKQVMASAAAARELHEVVGDSRVTGHQLLGSGLRRTEFSNGAALIVNYSDQPAIVDGVPVVSGSYVIIQDVIIQEARP